MEMTAVDSRVTELIDALENKQTDHKTGTDICKAIGYFFNSFYGAKETAAVYETLSPKAKKRFVTAWALAGLSLAYERKRSGKPTWDERKQASEEFSLRYLKKIERLFEKETKISFPLSEEFSLPRDMRLSTWMFVKAGREAFNDKQWMLGYVEEFVGEHSTLKQSFFRGMLHGVLVPGKLISVDQGFYFPYI